MKHSKQRPGTGHAPATSQKSQPHNSTKPLLSKYARKQAESTSMGMAMLSALRGGK